MPVSIVSPALHPPAETSRAAHVALSSCGGGMVAGNVIRLRVTVQAGRGFREGFAWPE